MAGRLRTTLSLLALLGWSPVATAKCVQDHSLGKCENCLTSVQCEHGRFCCPFLKKCVANSREACRYPIASCQPLCRDSDDPKQCACENEKFPDDWVNCDGSSGSTGGDSTSVPNEITRAFTHQGEWCVGVFENTWCWLADNQGKYAKDGKPYKCHSYVGYSADEWCYRTPEKNGNEEGTTDSSTATDGGSGGSAASDTFQCPSHWYADGAPTDSDAEAWTMAHNVFRCMHDVEFAQWSNPVAEDIESWLSGKRYMVHSDSYDVRPPAGPAGENLFSGQPASYWTPAKATSSWYSEVEDCSSFPGCGGGFDRRTGHFTAMIWAGVSKIGCNSNSHGLKGCRYKGADVRDCTVPNMGGCYNKMLPAAKKSLAACKAKVKECFGGKALPAHIEAFGLEDLDLGAASNSPGAHFRHSRAAVVGATAAALSGLGLLFALAWRSGRHRNTPCPKETEAAALFLRAEGPAALEEEEESAAEGL
uniref:SCP domain-containing protein n=1 Tax=Alexandrium monilatum TaxID=311494 RepID=A0A7S4RVR6_9DINO